MIQIMVPMVPPSPNVLRRKYRHPHAYKDLREAWEHSIAYSLERRERKMLVDAARHYTMRVSITIHHPGEYDPDNLQACQKPILDAMKNISIIHDDSARWIKLEPIKQVQCEREESKTEIEIEPIWDEVEAP